VKELESVGTTNFESKAPAVEGYVDRQIISPVFHSYTMWLPHNQILNTEAGDEVDRKKYGSYIV